MGGKKKPAKKNPGKKQEPEVATKKGKKKGKGKKK